HIEEPHRVREAAERAEYEIAAPPRRLEDPEGAVLVRKKGLGARAACGHGGGSRGFHRRDEAVRPYSASAGWYLSATPQRSSTSIPPSIRSAVALKSALPRSL